VGLTQYPYGKRFIVRIVTIAACPTIRYCDASL
jgi:hypothetical protein